MCLSGFESDNEKRITCDLGRLEEILPGWQRAPPIDLSLGRAQKLDSISSWTGNIHSLGEVLRNLRDFRGVTKKPYRKVELW